MTLCALTAATIVFFIVKLKRERWEVTCQADRRPLTLLFSGCHAAYQLCCAECRNVLQLSRGDQRNSQKSLLSTKRQTSGGGR